MKILVTGGAGFIGSHLCERLLEEGNKVISIDNFDDFYDFRIKIKNIFEIFKKKDKYSEFLEEMEKKSLDKKEILREVEKFFYCDSYRIYYEDIRDSESMEKIFQKERPELIINLAGLAGVRPSIERAKEYIDVNIQGFINLLELCKKYNIKKVIQASSSSVYGNNKKVPFEESDNVDFQISPYAGTKKSCEVLGYIYHHLYNIDMIQLRFFTVFGERQRPDLAIHKFIKAIREDKEIQMYGDGSSARDYTYVGDIVQGIEGSINYLLKNKEVYEIINLGNSNTISLKEMISTIEKLMDKKGNVKEYPKQSGDVDITFANINKARRLINYDPKTEFEEGVRKFIRWSEI
ncbi:GDP-mannose 4,6-dehydratase [Fusobacterium sp.]|uniref:GDP-mannose 4,6-dehydratase n=1 Tax=Fusobacterium sp. TaxID=68766 RepID=UPI00262A3D08|nr:GDP-mannose 4,6-dehydratase [Fusobacterium sp.]